MGQYDRDYADGQDEKLLAIFARFNGLDAALDELTSSDQGQDDPRFFALHQNWVEVCRQAAATPAMSELGRRLKAAMLLSVLKVLAPVESSRGPHELLAASIAVEFLAIRRPPQAEAVAEPDEIGIAVQPIGFHRPVLVKGDGARGYGESPRSFLHAASPKQKA
jgi:hypothetical protein